ncbi:enamine deaminase RidA (YjgF/YER057c/UK114 family) [Microbacterium sp. SORGH_AS 1204]|uniref:Rid family hydrolase n=1 Tax=Microbacterium sp. SORGH_AS_1204 TaxID=3041785 RepID=UPI0027915DFA|nr:Rid family hydrolase [Microbacterium sp. SORGH_AS_1204]MDQ1137795.1 enamine deaminase RidA (YjgF/YER057c/UK114 family) [Microbacterium sp. SORGH_AS_1204]
MSISEVVLPEGSTGRVLRDQFHYAAAHRVGDIIELSGHTGHRADLSLPEQLEEEIATAFANITATLEAAEMSWSNVFSVRTYHVVPVGADSIPGEAIGAILNSFAAHLPERYPVWTAIAVPALAFPGMRIEIEIKATY